MSNKSLSRLRDSEFIARAASINTQYAGRAAAGEIRPAQLTALNQLTTTAQAAYEANKDRTRRVVMSVAYEDVIEVVG